MVHDGLTRVLGVFDLHEYSHEDSSTSAFYAFTYTSRLPSSVLELLVDPATGHEPRFKPRSGRYATVGKFFLRRH